MAKGDRYVEVRREVLTAALEKAGFKVWEPHPGEFGCSELVYVRQHDSDPTMFVKVYTSLPARAGDARACGQDAIRACLVFERRDEAIKRWISGGLYKAPKVLRTGSEEKVIERTLERARECYREANKRAWERSMKKRGVNQ